MGILLRVIIVSYVGCPLLGKLKSISFVICVGVRMNVSYSVNASNLFCKTCVREWLYVCACYGMIYIFVRVCATVSLLALFFNSARVYLCVFVGFRKQRHIDAVCIACMQIIILCAMHAYQFPKFSCIMVSISACAPM